MWSGELLKVENFSLKNNSKQKAEKFYWKVCKLCCGVFKFHPFKNSFLSIFFSFYFIKVEAYQISSPELVTTIFYNIDNIQTFHTLDNPSFELISVSGQGQQFSDLLLQV